MAVGDVYEVRFEGGTCEATRWNIVTHYRKTAESDDGLFASSLALADALGTIFGSTPGDLLDTMHSTWSLDATRANRVYPSIGVSASSADGAGIGGQSGSDPMPSDIAAVVSKRTDEAGARFRGRNYFGGISEVQQNGGVLSGIIASGIQAAFEDLFGYTGPDAAGNEWIGVVFSKSQVDDALNPKDSPITRTLVDIRLRTQRGRSDGVASYV